MAPETESAGGAGVAVDERGEKEGLPEAEADGGHAHEGHAGATGGEGEDEGTEMEAEGFESVFRMPFQEGGEALAEGLNDIDG